MASDSVSTEPIGARVIRLAAEQTVVGADEVSSGSHFFEDLGYDSLDVAEFVMEVEDEFGVSLPDEQIQQFQRVRDVAAWLEAQAAGRGDG